LSIKRPGDLSSFPKLCIASLLGTLSARNLHGNFRQHFLADRISRRCHAGIYTLL
jgi:hypothetical protein